MFNTRGWISLGLLSVIAVPAMAQSFLVQCPTSTIPHPAVLHDNNSEPAYTGKTTLVSTNPGTPANGYLVPSANVNGAIKCQQISGGDGYATMGDGTQTYMFSFGPLSGLANIATGQPGTVFPSVFNSPYLPNGTTPLPPGYPASTTVGPALMPGEPATTIAATSLPISPAQLAALGSFYNGAIGLAPDIPGIVSVFDASEVGHTVTIVTDAPLGVGAGDTVVISNLAPGYDGTFIVTAANVTNPFYAPNFAFQYTSPATGLAETKWASNTNSG